MPIRVCILSFVMSLSFVMTAYGDSLEEELLSREREFITAIKQEDQAKMRGMLSDAACSVVPGRGRQTKEQILKRLADTGLESYKIDDVKAIQAGDDVGILSYKYSWTGSSGKEGEQIGAFYSTSTWIRSEGKWKVIFFQQTRLAE